VDIFKRPETGASGMHMLSFSVLSFLTGTVTINMSRSPMHTGILFQLHRFSSLSLKNTDVLILVLQCQNLISRASVLP
jgi:hypothetical protein